MTRYRIVDRQTRIQVGTLYGKRSRAQHRADKLDLDWGAIRYGVDPVYDAADALPALNGFIANKVDFAAAHERTVALYKLTSDQAAKLTRLYALQEAQQLPKMQAG